MVLACERGRTLVWCPDCDQLNDDGDDFPSKCPDCGGFFVEVFNCDYCGERKRGASWIARGTRTACRRCHYKLEDAEEEARLAIVLKIQRWWRKVKGIVLESETTRAIKYAECKMSFWLSTARSLVDRNARDRKKCFRCHKMITGLDYKRHADGGGYHNNLNGLGKPRVGYDLFYSKTTEANMGQGAPSWVFDKKAEISGLIVRDIVEYIYQDKFYCLRCCHEHNYEKHAWLRKQELERCSSVRIQQAWRRARDHPDYWMCKKIQLTGLLELGAIEEEDYAEAMGFTPPNELPPPAV